MWDRPTVLTTLQPRMSAINDEFLPVDDQEIILSFRNAGDHVIEQEKSAGKL